MTIINDTRVVRLQRTAARIGHQHSADERIVEIVTDELVTSSDVVSLPPGSLITLQRGPGSGHTEEGSVLNAAGDDIGGVAGGQTTSVSFDSEDAGATAASIFQTEVDFAGTLSASGEYAVNYKTFQIKTYDPVPTTAGSRILVSYIWAPIREYLEWVPEDLYPDLVAFGVGPHIGGGDGDGYDVYVTVSDDDTLSGTLINKLIAGHGIAFSIDNAGGDESLRISNDIRLDGYAFDSTVTEHYHQFGNIIQTILGELDGYHPDITGTEHYHQHSQAINHILQALDGYDGSVFHVRKLGTEADDFPFSSVFNLDGYVYPTGENRLIVHINGITQSPPFDYVERSTGSVEFVEPVDHDDVIDIWILPGSLGGGFGGTTDLQNAYDNSTSGSKTISVSDGQIVFTQTQATGSALKLNSTSSLTPALVIDQDGTGEALRLKSVSGSSSSLLVQKDTTARNTISNTTITERTTSHILGGQTGIGSAVLTRLESSGTVLFDASKIVTGTTSVIDSVENSYLSIELSEEGVLEEKARFTSDGSLGVNTNNPDATLHVQGDGYIAAGLEVAGQIKVHNSPNAPINIPVLTDDPPILKHGDVWASEIGGTRKINIYINGATYSVEIT